MPAKSRQKKPYPPNNFCPCNSGKKYKQCCLANGVEWVMQSNGKVLREGGDMEFDDLGSVIEADLIKSGASEETLYAFRKTGILVTRENEAQVTPEELQRWESAIMEYKMQRHSS